MRVHVPLVDRETGTDDSNSGLTVHTAFVYLSLAVFVIVRGPSTLIVAGNWTRSVSDTPMFGRFPANDCVDVLTLIVDDCNTLFTYTETGHT